VRVNHVRNREAGISIRAWGLSPR